MGASRARVRSEGFMTWGGWVGPQKSMYYRPDVGYLMPMISSFTFCS